MKPEDLELLERLIENDLPDFQKDMDRICISRAEQSRQAGLHPRSGQGRAVDDLLLKREEYSSIILESIKRFADDVGLGHPTTCANILKQTALKYLSKAENAINARVRIIYNNNPFSMPILQESDLSPNRLRQKLNTEIDLLCKKKPQQLSNSAPSIIAGNNSQFILGDNNKAAQNSTIDSPFNSNNTTDNRVIYYKNYKQKSLPITIKAINTLASICAILTFVPSIIKFTPVPYEVQLDDFLFYTLSPLMISGILFALVFAFKQDHYFKAVGLHLTSDEEGKIYRFKPVAKCSICGGDISVRYFKEFKRDLGVCEDNSDHTFTYNYKKNYGEPYTIQRWYSEPQ